MRGTGIGGSGVNEGSVSKFLLSSLLEEVMDNAVKIAARNVIARDGLQTSVEQVKSLTGITIIFTEELKGIISQTDVSHLFDKLITAGDSGIHENVTTNLAEQIGNFLSSKGLLMVSKEGDRFKASFSTQAQPQIGWPGIEGVLPVAISVIDSGISAEQVQESKNSHADKFAAKAYAWLVADGGLPSEDAADIVNRSQPDRPPMAPEMGNVPTARVAPVSSFLRGVSARIFGNRGQVPTASSLPDARDGNTPPNQPNQNPQGQGGTGRRGRE